MEARTVLHFEPLPIDEGLEQVAKLVEHLEAGARLHFEARLQALIELAPPPLAEAGRDLLDAWGEIEHHRSVDRGHRCRLEPRRNVGRLRKLDLALRRE